MLLTISGPEVCAIDLHPYLKYINHHDPKFFLMEAGENHCKLLAHLSRQLPKGSLVVDLGTLQGHSAVALATNPDVKVVTYDIMVSYVPDIWLPNLRSVHGDCKHYISHYKDAALILLDISPHDGVQERYIVEELQKQGFRGIIVFDDIQFAGLAAYWESLKVKKIDVTTYGHFSGTGIAIFDPNFIDVKVL